MQTLVSSSVCRTYMQTCSDLLLSMVPENDSVLVKLYMILAPVGPPVLANGPAIAPLSQKFRHAPWWGEHAPGGGKTCSREGKCSLSGAVLPDFRMLPPPGACSRPGKERCSPGRGAVLPDRGAVLPGGGASALPARERPSSWVGTARSRVGSACSRVGSARSRVGSTAPW